MFLMIQLVHLTCRKDRVQSPTRKEGWDLFQRICDDSSEEEPEDSWVKDTIAKERYSEEYKENGRWIIIQDEE